MTTRRQFIQGAAGAAGLLALGPAQWARAQADQLNILCWEGYNTDVVLNPFRKAHPEATVRAQSAQSDPAMVNKLRGGGTSTWDFLNVNQPWAQRIYPEGLIKELDKERFEPLMQMNLKGYKDYPLAYDNETGQHLIGMPQRFGPFSFVVNTDKISRETAEDQGWNLFFEERMKGRYAVITMTNWNLIHISLAAGLNPFEELDDTAQKKFRETADAVFRNAKFIGNNPVQMNLQMINGSIDAYFTGGTWTASPARMEGKTNVRAITPRSGPVDGKGGVVWIEVNSLVNDPNPTPLAADFLEFVIGKPEIAKKVAFAEGRYNPIMQMGDPDVMSLFDKDELNAIQWGSLDEELDRCLDYQPVPSYDDLIEHYTAAKREA